MEHLTSVTMWPNVVLTLFIFLVAATYLKKSKRRKAGALPPGPRRLPIIGNLHNIFGPKLPHQRLADLAKEYGPVMYIQMGQVPTLVISSRDAARAILKTSDQNFADRPGFLTIRKLTNNCRDVGFAPYGEYWRMMKKIFVVELLTTKRVESYRHIREKAVSMVVDEVLRAGTAPVNLSTLLYTVSNWTVSEVSIGKANSPQQLEYIIQIMNDLSSLSGGVNLADLFPAFESILSTVTGTNRKIRKICSKMDGVLNNVITQHMSSNVDEQKEEIRDVLDVLLRHYRLQDLEFPFSISDVKALVWDLFIGASETAAATTVWTMAEMMKNPDVMLKAQYEARRVYEEKGKMDDSVIDELHYMKLVLKETLRLHPPLPFLVPRQSRETCELNGYQIPAKTRVLVNAWALGRDPEYWVNPNEFKPERFEERPMDFKGTNYEYIPFGSGRRMCPGTNFGVANVEITLAKLFCHFDWRLPDGMVPEDLDMEETFGATIHKKVPLFLVASTRIPI